MNCRPRLYKGTFSFSRYSLPLEMASLKQSREDPNPVANQSASNLPNSGVGGVCMMSNAWREGQHSSFISFISSFLSANCFRLNFVPIPPDFIFNCGGLSVAFVFLTTWDCNNIPSIFSRIHKLKGQFANLIVAVTLPTREQNDSFVHSYFKYEMEVGRPLFMPVQDLEMGFVMIVNVAQSYGACKQRDSISRMKTERKQAVENMESFIGVMTSIPGIDRHDAIMLNQTIGSIETIAKLSKEKILESTDLSAEKAETITRFFRDPKFYLSPKLC